MFVSETLRGIPLPDPASAALPGRQAPYRDCAGWRYAYPAYRVRATCPDLPTCATETAGADGLKIAETFPEGHAVHNADD